MRRRRSARTEMPQQYHLWPDVQIDGSDLPGQTESLLEQVVVDHHQHQPSMFTITFHDPARDVISQLSVNIGSTVTIKMTPPGGTPETLIKGEVTGFEAEYDATRLRTILRGYDLSHRLHRGRNTQTYKNVTDSDIARQVAGNASLPIGTIDSECHLRPRLTGQPVRLGLPQGTGAGDRLRDGHGRRPVLFPPAYAGVERPGERGLPEPQ
jgi:hypothetical protein